MQSRWLFAVATVLGAIAFPATANAGASAQTAKTCSSSSVRAIVHGDVECLRAGEYCSLKYQSTYRHYGFVCELVQGGTERLEHR